MRKLRLGDVALPKVKPLISNRIKLKMPPLTSKHCLRHPPGTRQGFLRWSIRTDL